MRRLLTVLLGLALALAIAAFAWTRTSVGHLPWSLVSVSADARTLTIVHEEPHCGTQAGGASVDERADQVEITVPERRSLALLGACTDDLRFGTERVRLDAPLGRRRLGQPGGHGVTGFPTGSLLGGGSVPVAKECMRLTAMPHKAAARGVPWVARRLRLCTAPLPAAIAGFPLLRRGGSAADRLPAELLAPPGASVFPLRLRAARRLGASARLWFVPGLRHSCIARYRARVPSFTDCEETADVARRGLYFVRICMQRTPRRIDLLGVVPAGVERVRLEPAHGAPRTVRVHDGVWRSREVPWPLELRVGDERLRPDYRKRSCW